MKRLSLVLLALVMTSFAATNVGAYTKDDAFYDGNNIFFYDPDYQGLAGCQAGGDDAGDDAGAATVDVNAIGSNANVKTIFQGLLDGGMNAVQAAAVLGNIYIESGRTFDPNTYENGVNVPSSGYGIVQWTNDKDTNYTTGRRTNEANFAAQNNVAKSDLDIQIKFLLKEYNDSYKANLAGTPFATGTVVNDATLAWMNIFEDPQIIKGATDPAQENERQAAAVKIYGLYGSLTGATADDQATATSAGCDDADGTGGGGDADGDGGGAVNGDILATAEGYAWPGPRDGTAKSQARASYQLAKPQYSPGTEWSDCGGFVATVMLSSGVDPNFPDHSVNAQAEYMESHPEKYRIIPLTSLEQVQPGDLLIEKGVIDPNGHIEIVKDGEVTIDASLGERIPSTRPTGGAWMLGRGAEIARFTGAKT